MSHQRAVSKLLTVTMLLSAAAAPTQVGATGVFELEVLKLQQIDQRPQMYENISQSSVASISGDDSSNNLVRVWVCLKEAFTSKLDGPCTFGNASITVNKPLVVQQANEASTNYGNTSLAAINKQSNDEQTSSNPLGSQVTNIVRILFTFRWTKAFTIILTAEELQLSSSSTLDKRQPIPTVHHQHHKAINGIHLVDSSHVANKSVSGELLQETAQLNNKHPIPIDRHVSTENEVLPNLEISPNKPWASRFSRSSKSSVSYRFRVYCSLNYYGDGCTTFCRARDDQFGHYNCSSTGQKVCLEGWHGPDCDRAKCRPGCNRQHGYCEKPDTCMCRPGWTGSRCDECLTYPGCRNGYCLSPWQCICQLNWGGVLCDQDLNYCGTHEPCKNNGTCQNVAPGKYKCHCTEGFTGVDCDINVNLTHSSSITDQLNAGCAVNPCLNGGICLGYNSFAPELLLMELPEASSNSSDIGGLFYRCQCPTGWSGDYCQWFNPSAPVTVLLANITERTISSPDQIPITEGNSISDTTTIDLIKEAQTLDNLPLHVTAYIGSNQSKGNSMSMRHLISWVVIASVIGVFIAALTLAWACLIAIEHNRFSFIQMNIIRNSNEELGADEQPIVSSALRRVHNKLRNSFRRSSRNKIKPETKLSIENVLRPPKPPPSYEESSYYHTNKMNFTSGSINDLHKSEAVHSIEMPITKQNLVIKESLEPRLLSTSISTISELTEDEIVTSSAKLNCPRHGYLYRKGLQDKHNNFAKSTQHTSCYHKHINQTSYHYQPTQKHYTTNANNNHHVDLDGFSSQ